jgi:hypothetical protein
LRRVETGRVLVTPGKRDDGTADDEELNHLPPRDATRTPHPPPLDLIALGSRHMPAPRSTHRVSINTRFSAALRGSSAGKLHPITRLNKWDRREAPPPHASIVPHAKGAPVMDDDRDRDALAWQTGVWDHMSDV